jgi:hypothetical protein
VYTNFPILWKLVSRRKSSWRFFCCYIKIAKPLLNTLESRLWCKFFLLAVFATMYLNDVQRGDFYATIGLDSRQFDKHVIRKTNQSAEYSFPCYLRCRSSWIFLNYWKHVVILTVL